MTLRPVPAVLVAVTALLAGCSSSAGGTRADDRPSAIASSSPSPSSTCRPGDIGVRAAQVLVVGVPGATEIDDPIVQEVTSAGVGGVFLTETNVESREQMQALTSALRETARYGLLITTDEEVGRVSSFGDVLGRHPSARRLAATRTPEEVRELGAEMGAQLKELGIDTDLAPVADLTDGPAGNVIGDRSWSGDPQTSADYALAFAQGLQDGGITPVIKHFPGHGRSEVDSHSELPVVDAPIDELRETDLVPFVEAIEAGLPVVMLNHIAYSELDPELPATLSPKAYELLRSLGFEGVAMTDSLGMGAVNLRWDFPTAAVKALAAGADALLTTTGDEARRMRDEITKAVGDGRLSEERLNEAVTRVLRLKGIDPAPITCASAE